MVLKRALTFFIIASALLIIVPVRSTTTAGVYDPWIDTNDDGIVNYQDLYNLAVVYGTSGTPINKTDLLLEMEARITSLEARVETLEVLKVVAAGFIASDGSVTTGYNLDSVTWIGDTLNRYEISITGVSYFWTGYITVVTPTGEVENTFASTGSVGGDLLVYIHNSTGDRVQNSFQFVTYEVP